jgi:hypothetical protein
VQVFSKTLQRRDLCESDWQARLLLECMSLMTQCILNWLLPSRRIKMRVETKMHLAQVHLDEPSPPFQLLSVEDLVPEGAARSQYAEVAD